MRILHIIITVDPKYGGPVAGLRSQAPARIKTGHVTEVLTLDEPTDCFVQEFPFKVHAVGRGISKYRYNRNLERWIYNNHERFDVAVVHGLWNHAAVGGGHALIKVGLPYVVFSHGMLDPWFKKAYPFKHLLKQVFWTALQSKVVRCSSSVLFTSEEERRQSQTPFYGGKFASSVVPYGAENPSKSPDAYRTAFFEKFNSLKEKRFLLFMSRIHPKKGCDILLEAFAEVADRYHDVDVVIAGPDQVGWSKILQERAREIGVNKRVHWTGMLTGELKWGALYAAEAFVLPSHQENFGIVVAEALACQLPVLISNKVNIWREISEANAGYVANDDMQGTEKLLNKWLEASQHERGRLRENARMVYEKSFTIDSAARFLLSVLTKASENAPRNTRR